MSPKLWSKKLTFGIRFRIVLISRAANFWCWRFWNHNDTWRRYIIEVSARKDSEKTIHAGITDKTCLRKEKQRVMYFDAFELLRRLRWNCFLIQIEESDSFEPSTLLGHRLVMHFYVLYIKETNFSVQLKFNTNLSEHEERVGWLRYLDTVSLYLAHFSWISLLILHVTIKSCTFRLVALCLGGCKVLRFQLSSVVFWRISCVSLRNIWLLRVIPLTVKRKYWQICP